MDGARLLSHLNAFLDNSTQIDYKTTAFITHWFFLLYYIHLILLSVRCECVFFQTQYFSHFSISFFNHCLWFSLRENRCFFSLLLSSSWLHLISIHAVSALCNVHVWCVMHDDRVGCGLFRSIVLSRIRQNSEKKIETRSFFVCKKMNCTLDVFEEDREIDIRLLPYFYSTFFDFFSIRSFRFRFYLQCLCVFFYSFEAKR